MGDAQPPPPPHVRWHAAFWYNYSSKIKLCSLLVLKQNSGAPFLQKKNPGSAPVIPLNLLFFLLFLIWVPIFWLTLAQIFIQKGVLGIYYHRNRSQFNGSRGIHYSTSSPRVSNKSRHIYGITNLLLFYLLFFPTCPPVDWEFLQSTCPLVPVK